MNEVGLSRDDQFLERRNDVTATVMPTSNKFFFEFVHSDCLGKLKRRLIDADTLVGSFLWCLSTVKRRFAAAERHNRKKYFAELNNGTQKQKEI
jgi:hypothetical protein